MVCRGIRGANSVKENTSQAIQAATEELLRALIEANDLKTEDVACAIFTTTPDLNAAFPAATAREKLGWVDVPLMCGHEMDVPNSPRKILRVMLLVNTDRPQSQVAHRYLNEARKLRPDMSAAGARK